MTAIENYKAIVKKIFLRDLDVQDSTQKNNCTGALNNRENFSVFTDNFISRLQRLQEYFKDDSSTIDNILVTLKAIALAKGYKWSGPYSELVALDYWVQFENLTDLKYVDRGPVSSFEESLAKQIGQTEVDLDISFNSSFSKIFMDVKSLIPTHLELVDQILNAVKSKISTDNYLIAIDDLFEVDYLRTKKDYIYELRQGTLIEDLVVSIQSRKTYHQHTLQSGTNAKFRIAYTDTGEGAVLTTMRSMDPYRLASDYKYKVLDYYNKLLVNKPSYIVLVSNPWFNTEMNDFSGFNDKFFRALSRRVFCELTKNTEDMGDYFPELEGKNIKICDVARLISGIIFINDHSIKETEKNQNSVYIFSNPNATNISKRVDYFEILRWDHSAVQPKIIDNFLNDNY